MVRCVWKRTGDKQDWTKHKRTPDLDFQRVERVSEHRNNLVYDSTHSVKVRNERNDSMVRALKRFVIFGKYRGSKCENPISLTRHRMTKDAMVIHARRTIRQSKHQKRRRVLHFNPFLRCELRAFQSVCAINPNYPQHNSIYSARFHARASRFPQGSDPDCSFSPQILVL